MRILRLTAAATAVAAAVLVDPRLASAYTPPDQQLALSPTSGPRTTSITATFTFPLQGKQPPAIGCSLERVTFSWDARLLDQKPAGPAGDHSCVASLTFTPPGGLDAPGGHRVVATGGGSRGGATFTVTGAPAPNPVPPSPQSPTPVPPIDTSTALPSAPASPLTGSSAALPSTTASDSAEPLPSEVPSYEASPAIAGAALKPPSGTSIGVIIAILVGAMTIAGAGLLIGLAMRNRPDADDVSQDGLTAEP